MSYIVTARKWRPQRFEEIIGQEHISKTLKNSLLNNRTAHAYLFTGPRGVGKTTTARILAKSINCTNLKDGEACGECDLCKNFQNSQTMDIIEIDGASNRRIEEIRALRESVKYAPTAGKYKVYIIDEVHMLTPESFNALLKTLEEPPDHVIFIFATTDVHKVPSTIISRCQRFDFRRIELDNIKNLLKKIADTEGIEIDDLSLTIIAKKADGALRDAQSLFDQVVSFSGNKIKSDVISRMLNLIDEDIYFDITDAILAKKFEYAFTVSNQIYENGWNFIDFMNGLIEHVRNLLTIQVRGNSDLIESSESYKKRYMSCVDKFSVGDLLRILAFLTNVQNELRFTQNHRLKIEISLSHLIGLEKSSTISEILSRLESGEITTVKSEEKSKVDTKPAPVPTLPFTPSPENVKPATPSEPDSTAGSMKVRWTNLLDSVNAEKFTVGALLNQVKLVDYVNNKFIVQIENQEDKDILKGHKDYLDKKTKEVFGKKIMIDFANLSAAPNSSNENQSSVHSMDKNRVNDNTSLVNRIVNELGGKEIRSSRR